MFVPISIRDVLCLCLVSTGHLFDLNALSRTGGYTVYDPMAHRKMFRLNVCGEIADAGCASETGMFPYVPFN